MVLDGGREHRTLASAGGNTGKRRTPLRLPYAGAGAWLRRGSGRAAAANASTSALAAKGWEHEVRIGARAPIGQGRVVASHERIARGFGEGIAFVPNAGVEISRLIGEVVRENEAFRLEAALTSRLRDGGIEAEGLHGGSDHEFSGLVSRERALSKGSSVGVGMTLTHIEMGGITLAHIPESSPTRSPAFRLRRRSSASRAGCTGHRSTRA